MKLNKLSLNKEKTKMLVLSKNKQIKKELRIRATPEDVTHSPVVKILGIEITEDISFLLDGKASVYNQLHIRLNALVTKKNYTFPNLEDPV